MIVPEHVIMNRGVGLSVSEDYAYDIESIYKVIREMDIGLKQDPNFTMWGYSNIKRLDCSYWMNDSERGKIPVRFEFQYPTDCRRQDRPEIIIIKSYMLDNGVAIPVRIHYPVAYAITEKHKTEYGDSLLDISFYDKEDNLVVKFRQVGGWSFRCKSGRFALDPSQISPKTKKNLEGGCLYCDKARYVKVDGIVYLKCTKYDGMVKEVEYDGLSYPDYCKRR